MNYVIKPVHGCYQSYDQDGNKLIFSGTHWECEFWTEELLRTTLKDGRVVHNVVVGGKL